MALMDGSGRLGRAARAVDSDPRLSAVLRAVRDRLPGDSRYGDPLSLSGDTARERLGLQLATRAPADVSNARELGLSALQVWQDLLPGRGRRAGATDEATVMLSDLASFSNWSLAAGDDATVAYLRAFVTVTERHVARTRGAVVKRLGDGFMAVFAEPRDAVRAALDCAAAVDDLEVDGHRLRLRSGLHLGRPTRLDGDYFGVDVNIAARVMAAAGPGRVLVSDAVAERLAERDPSPGPSPGPGEDDLVLRRKHFFRAKGVPTGTGVHSVRRV